MEVSSAPNIAGSINRPKQALISKNKYITTSALTLRICLKFYDI